MPPRYLWCRGGFLIRMGRGHAGGLYLIFSVNEKKIDYFSFIFFNVSFLAFRLTHHLPRVHIDYNRILWQSKPFFLLWELRLRCCRSRAKRLRLLFLLK